jgi:hypothetical protein
MSIVKDDCVDTEQAIRVLQKAGYSVFKDAAGIELYYRDTLDSARVASYNEDPTFMAYWQRNAAQRMVHELVTTGLIEFDLLAPTPDDRRSYPMTTMSHIQASLKAFPLSRKEFKRG